MLKLPGAGEELPPLVIPGAEPEPVDQPELLPDDSDNAGMVKVRRRKKSREGEDFDETFADKEELSPRLVRSLIGSVAVLGLILLVALLWPRGEQSEVVDSEPLPPVEVVDSGPSEEDLEAERQYVRPILIEEELVPVYRKFLDAESPEEMAKWVRHPEISLPRIKKFYEDGYRPVGLSKVVWGKAPRRIGNAIDVVIQDGNFVRHKIYAVDEDGWKIDWESWAGWTEIAWKEMKEKRPTEPVKFRVVVSDVSYYNFSFTDESEWSGYRLESKDGEHALFGYVPRTGRLDTQLKSLEGIKNRFFILKLHYPEDSASDNQVIVEDIISDSWFDPENN